MCLLGDNQNQGGQSAWSSWSDTSKAITFEHFSMKMKTLRDYREKGLFSFKNLAVYVKTIGELDRFYTKSYLEAWAKMAKAHRIETLKLNLQEETAIQFEG